MSETGDTVSGVIHLMYRPRVMEAMIWDGSRESATEIVRWVTRHTRALHEQCEHPDEEIPRIELELTEGWYVVRRTDGTFTTYDPDCVGDEFYELASLGLSDVMDFKADGTEGPHV